ncbi:conserved membrane hypothetical protein [Hyella patelloides LEGE 07179]|uniref:Uncharacterized protein n=1 Tax=Hyella patelloides LEGE 07179 TaxID=945734 RepID=A0A563W2I4_9CYAN|nr:hypothetical protein [Hyella patelloides]VEP17901.1 conserved membrane hypothetical protein [Hyella patelloides LEGE 07179]
MKRKQKRISRIICSILALVLPIALNLLGLNWISAIAIGVIIAIALLILTSSLSSRIQNFSTWIGYSLIAAATILMIVFGVPQITEQLQPPKLVYGYVGGERYELLVRDLSVQELIKEADLQISEGSVIKKGSISQLKTLSSNSDIENIDFIWTGDAPIAAAGKEIMEARGKKVLFNEATLSDPLVLVMDRVAAEAASERNFLTQLIPGDSLQDSGFEYKIDTVSLADFLGGNWTWKDIGLNRYISPPGVIMSDARKSNGGLMAETLLGTIFYNINESSSNNRLLTSKDIPQFQPLPKKSDAKLSEKMEQLRLHSGFAESTSSKIQTQLEEGGIPWSLTYYSLGKKIVGDHNNFALVALSQTLINSNQFLSFSESGTKLLKILQSDKFPEIAREYGYDSPQGSWSILPDQSFEAIKNLTGLNLDN